MKIIIIGLALAGFCLSQAARASLGEGVDSIETDRQFLAGTRNAAKTYAAYTVEEIATGSGSVREYVSAAGQVFAIAWSGYRHPGLSTLLGSSYADYQGALRQSRRRLGHRGSRAVAGTNVSVETWGHLRNLHGRAYLANQLPDGVTKHEIR